MWTTIIKQELGTLICHISTGIKPFSSALHYLILIVASAYLGKGIHKVQVTQFVSVKFIHLFNLHYSLPSANSKFPLFLNDFTSFR